MSVRTIGSGAGIAGVALFLVASLIPGVPPRADSSATTITAYFVDHRSALLTAAVLLVLALAAFTLFVARLWTVLARADSEGHLLTTASVIAWLLLLGAVLIAVLVQTTIAWLGADSVAPDAVRFAYAFSMITIYGGTSTATATLVGATSIVIYRTGIMPRWVAVLGAVEVVANLVELAGLPVRWGWDAAGYAAGIGPLLWVVWVASVAATMDRPAAKTSPLNTMA